MGHRVIVVGAGIAGLSAGFRLQQQGCDVTVLEASDAVGGKMLATERDGFVVNRGAALLPTTYTEFAALAAEAGVGDALRRISPVMGVLRHGRIHRLRTTGIGAVLDGVRTPLLSARSKLAAPRLLRDALRARRRLSYEDAAGRAALDTESVGAYCARRLPDELRDNAIEPLLNGLLTADAMNASVSDLFFILSRMLSAMLYGTPGRIDFVCRALADRLDVRTGVTVTGVETGADGVTVRWDGGEETVAGCVLAVPGPLAPVLHPQLDPRVQAIINEGLEHVDTISVRFALRRAPDERALAIVVPGDELDGLASVILEHLAAPACAPPGKGLVAAFWNADWCAARVHLDDDELIGEMLALIESVLPGITELVEFAVIDRWAPSNPTFRPGNHKLYAELDGLRDPAGRVQLAGDYLGFPLVEASAVTGRTAARRLVSALG